MSTQRVLMLTFALAVTAGCAGRQAVEVSAADPALNTRWHANIASPSTLAGVVQMNGSASMMPTVDGRGTIVTLNLANAAPGGTHPWAIHWGQCGEGTDRGVFGAHESYRSLAVRSDGQATSTVTLDIPTPRNGSYFVVVRASETNTDMVVACGNLAPPTR